MTGRLLAPLSVAFCAAVVGCPSSGDLHGGPSEAGMGIEAGDAVDGAAPDSTVLHDGGPPSDAATPMKDGDVPVLPDGGYDAGSITPAACGGKVHCVRAGESIQAAVNAAADGDVVQVAGGTFNEDVSVLAKSLTLAGGFDTTFAIRDTTAYESRIQGSGTRSVVRLAADGKATRLDGFSITGGTGSAGDAYSGAGVSCQNGDATIANNHIFANKVPQANIHMTDTRGGGIVANGFGATKVAIVGNVIEDNVSGRGAGIASSGIAIVIIQGNVIRNNRGYSDHGGGLFINSPNVTIRGNRVEGNEIGPAVNPYGWGGGIFLSELGTMAYLSYNVVAKNKAISDGSGVFFNNGAKGTLDHELYYANACPQDSSAAILVEATDPQTPGTITVSYSTVADHPCQSTSNGNGITLGSPGCRANVTRSIFFNNGPNQFVNAQGAEVPPAVSDSFVDKDPQFVDSANHDYHLKPGSPATGFGVY